MSDRRRSIRVHCDLSASLKAGDDEHDRRVTDLSIHGARLQPALPWPVETQVSLQIELDGEGLTLDAIVLRQHSDHSAVCFDGPNEEARRRISQFTGALVQDPHIAEQIFLNAPVGMMYTDKEGLILAVNPAFCRITGYAAAEVLGKNPRMLQSGHHTPEFYEAMWHAVSTYGYWQGEIWNRRKSGEPYPELLTIVRGTSLGREPLYVGLFSEITDLKPDDVDWRRRAYHDHLTGLANRALFDERLRAAFARSRRSSSVGVVVMFDLDGFKAVNDSQGHRAGDRLLKTVADCLDGGSRETDLTCRMGGDEFAIIMEDISADHAAKRVRILIECVQSETEDAVGISAGLSIFPIPDMTPDDILQRADHAMYEAKRQGGNRLEIAPDT